MLYHNLFLQSAPYIKECQAVALFDRVKYIFFFPTKFITYFFGKWDEH